MIKKILIAILVLFGLVLIVLLGLYLIPPKQEIITHNNVKAQTDTTLNSKVGWYANVQNEYYQVTWGAKGGLRMNHFDTLRSNLESIGLTPVNESEFDTDGDLKTLEVLFQEQDSSISMMLPSKKHKLTKLHSRFYEQHEIQYSNAGVNLTGLLLIPPEIKDSTAIVFIHGSGISDRNNFWYMYKADYLARAGFIVLLPDKRGCGKSSGAWRTASFDDFAEDALAGVNYLLKHHGSKFQKIGILGLSQGGWIAHAANRQSRELNFIVDVVSSASTPNEQVHFEIMNDIMDSGAPQFLAEPLARIFAKRARGRRKVWWDKNGSFDPIPLIRSTEIPILKIFAAMDKNVPVERSLEIMDRVLNEQPGLQVTVKVFEDSGHGLFDAKTEWVRSDYLEFLVKWIRSQ